MSSRSGHTTTRRALLPGNRIRSNYYQETYSLPQGAYTPGTQQGQPGPSPAVTQYGVVDPTAGAVYANKPLDGPFPSICSLSKRTLLINKQALKRKSKYSDDNDQIYDVVEDPTMIAAYGGNVPMFVEVVKAFMKHLGAKTSMLNIQKLKNLMMMQKLADMLLL